MTRTARLLIAVSCALLLGVGVTGGAAWAGRLSSSSRLFTLGWTPTFTGGLGTIECERITLGGTFHSQTFTKVAGGLIGYIGEGAFGRCSRGSARILGENLPWHFRYGSFSGTLPRIASIRFQIIGFTVGLTEPVFGISCLFRSTAERPAFITARLEELGTVSSITGEGTIPAISGCSGTSATMAGEGRGPNQIRWTLI